MSETTIATARAQVLVYDDYGKKWIPSGANGVQAVAKVQILQHVQHNTFRLVGRKVQEDHEVVLNCPIARGLRYNQATPIFHQWRVQVQVQGEVQHRVYGLNFTTADEAANFSAVMLQALDYLASIAPTEYQLPLNGPTTATSQELNNGYHHPSLLTVAPSPHHVSSEPNFRQQHPFDDDAISTHSASQQQPSFRKSSQQPVIQNHQRRASQGSSGSGGSTTPSTNNAIYAPSGGASPSRAAPPTPGLQAPAISSSAPPPPAPPPPPSALRNGAASHMHGLAEQLKMTTLRKTGQRNVNGGSDAVIRESKTSTNGSSADSVSVGGGRSGESLMDELTATINRRKNLVEPKADEVVENGTSSKPSTDSSVRRPWETTKNTTNGVTNTTTAVTDSPKSQHRNFVRRAPSGSSLSSQEEPIKTISNGITMTNGGGTTMAVTVETLERWKSDLMIEVRAEINKAKIEIIEALRAELLRR